MGAVRYPAAKVRIQVRFEDFKATPVLPPLLPKPGTGPEAFGLGVVHDIPIGTFKSVGFDIVPLNFTVEKNSPRKADTAKVELLYRQLPFNPQILKAATIQVFAGMVSSEDFARACGPTGAQGLLLPDVVPQGWAFAGQSNEIFRGFIDDWTAIFESTERIELTARDCTGFLLDAECPENMLRRLPVETKLDAAIKYLLFGDGLLWLGLPGMRGLEIVVESKRWQGDHRQLPAGPRAEEKGQRRHDERRGRPAGAQGLRDRRHLRPQGAGDRRRHRVQLLRAARARRVPGRHLDDARRRGAAAGQRRDGRRHPVPLAERPDPLRRRPRGPGERPDQPVLRDRGDGGAGVAAADGDGRRGAGDRVPGRAGDRAPVDADRLLHTGHHHRMGCWARLRVHDQGAELPGRALVD